MRALIFKCAWVIPIKLKPSLGFSNSILSPSGHWAFFDLFEHLCFQKENLKKARGLLVYASSRVSYNCFYCKPSFWAWAFDPEPIYWARAFQPEHKPAQALAQWNHEGTVDDFSHSPIFFVDLKVRRRFSDPTWFSFSWWVSASSSSWGQSFKQKFLCGCSTVVKRKSRDQEVYGSSSTEWLAFFSSVEGQLHLLPSVYNWWGFLMPRPGGANLGSFGFSLFSLSNAAP